MARYRWKLDVALEAVKEAKSNLKLVNLSGKSNNRDRRVSADEIVALTAHFRAKRRGFIPMADIIEFALATGMRLGEICRIRREDYETANRIITIRDRKHPKDKIGNNQRVPLLTVAGFDPAIIIARQPRASDRIFPVDEHSVCRMFAKAVAALGIKDLHFHDLRHEAISRLFSAGYRIEQVALVSGSGLGDAAQIHARQGGGSAPCLKPKMTSCDVPKRSRLMSRRSRLHAKSTCRTKLRSGGTVFLKRKERTSTGPVSKTSNI